MRRPRWTEENGCGLFVIAQLTRRWDSRYGRTGKTIWAEMVNRPRETVFAWRLASLLSQARARKARQGGR